MQLPVSGLEVQFRAPDGTDDLAILEAGGTVLDRAIGVLSRLAHTPETDAAKQHRSTSDPRTWEGLPVTDFEIALLGLRRHLFGDTIACVFRCTSPQCGERMELELSIRAFLEDVRPKRLRWIEPAEEKGWFRLKDETATRFRFPVVRDQLTVQGRPQSDKLLAERCIEMPNSKPRGLARIERAMEAMAPLVSRPINGTCPICAASVTIPLHVPRLVVDELKMAASGVYEEIHVIAETYHWSEISILAIPQSRRQAYVEVIRQQRRLAS